MLTQMAPPAKLIDVSPMTADFAATTIGNHATATSSSSSLSATSSPKPAPTVTKTTTTTAPPNNTTPGPPAPATTMQTNGHQQAAQVACNRPIKLKNVANGEQTVDTLHLKYKNNNKSHSCNETRCLGSVINAKPVEFRVRTPEETLEQAVDFINNYYASIKRLDSPAHKNRLKEIEDQIKSTDTYYLKETELIYGAKLAWRNAPRCIGRIQWSKLQVFDARFTKNENEMFEALCNHIKYATNKGSIRSAITIFPQRVKSTDFDWRIWNNQLISYAGYRDKDTGKVIGDPINADLTEICQKLGWKGKGTRFDLLPLVMSANGGPPQMFPLPEELALRVKLKHPKYKWFEELALEWYALPAVSNMMLDLGGLQFTACPFNGWYMVTEIGSRDLGDVYRYNVLEEIAQRLGLNTKSNSSLWRDQAVLELNIAVLDSFQSAGVTIVDHHTASETFMTHLANEQRLRGGCPADWVWLVPPTAGSTTQVFHQEMVNYHLLPNYEYMDAPWKNFNWLEWERKQEEKRLSDQFASGPAKLGSGSLVASPLLRKIAAAGSPLKLALQHDNHHLGRKSIDLSPSSVGSSNGDLTPRRLRFKEIARAVKFTSKLFGKALSRRIKATILYATETGKSERFANKLAQTFSCAFNVHLMSMSDYDLTCLEHEALLLIVTSTFGNGDPPENGEAFAKHLAAVKLTGDTSPDLDSINSVSTNPFFQMLSEDHKDGQSSSGISSAEQKSTSSEASASTVGHKSSDLSANDDNNNNNNIPYGNNKETGNNFDDSYNRRLQTYKRIQEQQTNIRPLSNVRFSVFALGSTAYPHFCAFGRYVDQTLGELGAERIAKCTCGDELAGQEKVFNEWSSEVFKIACDVFCLTDSIGPIDARPEIVWSPNDVRFAPIELIDFESSSSRQQQVAGTPTSTRFNPAIGNGSNSSPAWFGQKDLSPRGGDNESSSSNASAVTAAQRQSFNDLLSNKKTIVQNLMSITGKKIVPFTVMARQDLHRFMPEENLQTLNMDLECDLVAGPCQTGHSATLIKQSSTTTPTNGSHNLPKLNLKAPPILFEPGDHVGIYPINKSEMVEKLLARIKRDVKIRDQRYNDEPLADLELTPTYKSSATSNIDFDQVYRVLVRRENMDLTPATSSPLSQNGREDNWIPYDRLPITTIREALTRYLDITNPPNQEFLATLARLTSDLEEKKRLQQMARTFSIYEEWKNKNVPTLLSTLEEFKTIRFEPALITQMPLMKPRFYSISGTNISLTLGVVRFKTASGELREGLCSNYMNTIPLGPKSYIYGYVRSAPAFHMPQNKSLPMILIGAGTGIAPFRSFWQQRYSDMYRNTTAMTMNQSFNATILQSPSTLTLASVGNQQESSLGLGDFGQRFAFGRIELYFGCRNSNYILYKDELDQMYENGVISSINIAFSRPIDRDIVTPEPEVTASSPGGNINTQSTQATNKISAAHHQQDKSSTSPVKCSKVETIKQARRKMYVQDKLLENSAEVYKLIMSDEAHVYVCGDVAMADGVYKTLAKLLSKENSEDGETVLMNLRNLNRYHEDIFGAKQMS